MTTRTAHQKSTFCTLVVFWDPKLLIPKYCICRKFKTSYQKNYKNCKQQAKLKKKLYSGAGTALVKTTTSDKANQTSCFGYDVQQNNKKIECVSP